MAHKWPVVGAARRFWDGIAIEMVDGSTFAIAAHDVEALLFDHKTVPIYQTSEISMPFRCGEAYVSTSKRMVLLGVPGACREGAAQVSLAHLAAHYRRGERRAVQVVRAPTPALPGRLAVV